MAFTVLRRAAPALLLAVLAAPATTQAASTIPLDDAGTDIHNTASLQRGARNFVNYCLGCHSAQYVRWNRVAADLGITEKELQDNLMFNGGSAFDVIRSSMAAEDAARWFGNAPPDLSLIARSRGTDYVYTFLRSYYADASRPSGVNNLVLPGTAMPHVLAGLQGLAEAKYETKTLADGKTEQHLVGLTDASGGELDAAAYDEFVRDTVNFLDYMGEPVKAKRERLGVWVILFLLVFFGLSYLLKQEDWKDVK